MSDAPTEPRSNRPTSARYQPLVIVLVAVCAGILADRRLEMPVGLWWMIAIVAWAAWLALWRTGCNRTAGLILLIAVAAVAGAWHHCRWSLFAENDLGHYARARAEPACVEAIALKGTRRLPAPEHDPMQIIPRGDRTRLDVALVGIRDRADWQPVSGRATLLVDGHLLGVHVGDRVRVFTQLAATTPARNPGEFDHARHVRADRQRSVLRAGYPDCVSVVRRASGWNPRQQLDAVRNAAEDLLWQHLEPRHAGLAAAVLLGDRDELGAQRSQAFQETGTVHLLAISGLHVGILVLAMAGLLRLLRVPRIRAAVIVAGAAILYTILTDARPPAIRATILVLVWSASRIWGRRAISFNSLAAAALVILALNPADLFRVGPQLSFLAVAALMWFAPAWFGSGNEPDPIDRLIAESRPWLSRTFWYLLRSARHLTLVSATIWLFALPLVMARFHLFTPVAIVLNTLLWIPMYVALTSGFALLTVGWLCPPVGALVAKVCNLNLWAIDSGIQLAREIPHGHAWVAGPAEWWLIGFYGALGLFAAVPRVRPPRRWALALAAGWIGLGFATAAAPDKRPQVDCTFLSVNHGCAVVLTLPSGKTMLYDAGCFTSPHRGAQTIAGCLWDRGATHLDAVVLSHADADHYNALPELLERFSVGVVYVSPMMFYDENFPLKKLREAIDAAGVPIREIRAGDHLSAGAGCRIEVLHPPGRGVLGDDNANSLVLDVEYQGRRILLPGDLQSPGLDDLMAEEPIDCDVLMVPHHGSRRSNPPGLAAWCTPEIAVISGSLQRDPTPTESAYRAADARVLHTGRGGAVRVTLDATGVEASCFLGSGSSP